MISKQSNSKRSRVEPVFGWFEEQVDHTWPSRLVRLSSGLTDFPDPGVLQSLIFRKEVSVPPSTDRLGWMIENAELLAAHDGARWRELLERAHHSKREKALESLRKGVRQNVPGKLILEGPTRADCVVECTRAVIWVEGKRYDWISPSTTWDVLRDQL